MVNAMNDPRLNEFQRRYGCELTGGLGLQVGQDGRVLSTNRLTAVKFFDREHRFQREHEVYRVLSEKKIAKIAGHNVPQFCFADVELMAIEMTLVPPPFILDFANAKRPWEVPEFDQEIMDEYHDRLRELFGARWSDALHVAAMFRGATGFELMDLHPGNIAFDDPAPP
jgi:hypothetical protein